MKGRPTIKDIAALVGVSPSTVSYVLNDSANHKISEGTRQAILQAAKTLQYIPNGAARALRNNSSHCVSVALEKTLTQTRFGTLLQGIRMGLRSEGYWLMLFDFDSRGQLYPEFIESVLQSRSEGIIYISSDGSDPRQEWRESILANNLPFVACDCCPPEEGLASVSFDYERGAFEVGCRLLGEGARRILYWRPSIQTDQEQYRESGLRRAADLYPGAEVIVSKLPYEEAEDCLDAERHARLSQICKQHMVQSIIPGISRFQPGDAVVCSWGVMARHLGAALNGARSAVKIASLSAGEIPLLPDSRLLISRPRFLYGGEVAARLLLRQIRGETLEENRVVIAPEPPQYVEL